MVIIDLLLFNPYRMSVHTRTPRGAVVVRRLATYVRPPTAHDGTRII
jgi:hypothetical protein